MDDRRTEQKGNQEDRPRRLGVYVCSSCWLLDIAHRLDSAVHEQRRHARFDVVVPSLLAVMGSISTRLVHPGIPSSSASNTATKRSPGTEHRYNTSYSHAILYTATQGHRPQDRLQVFEVQSLGQCELGFRCGAMMVSADVPGLGADTSLQALIGTGRVAPGAFGRLGLRCFLAVPQAAKLGNGQNWIVWNSTQ